MKSICDLVAERFAVGDPLGDAAEHVSSCQRCQRLAGLTTGLAATHREVDPGLGFSARMTAGAQHRLGVRRRRRIAAGMAATVAAGALGVVALTREPQPVAPVVAVDTQVEDPDPHPDPVVDEDARALLRFANVDRSSRLSADWSRIARPLSPYKKLTRGVKP